MSITREFIKDSVEKGLLIDIFRFEQSLALIRKIAEYSNVINNSSNGNFGRAFGAINAALSTEAVLSASRINDNPSKKYPTRCLKGLLKYLEDYNDDLPSLKEKHQLITVLQTRDDTKILIDCVRDEPQEFCKQLKRYVSFKLEVSPLLELNYELKTYRDKVLAHNEKVESIISPLWVSIEELISLAKFVVSALGWAYFSTAYSFNGDYISTRDAQRSSKCLDRLINQLYHKKN